MKIKYGSGKTEYGPGVEINLTGDEVAAAIDTWLVAHNVRINGPRTTKVNGESIEKGRVYVDPSGHLIWDGELFDGRGPKKDETLYRMRHDEKSRCWTSSIQI